MNVEQGMFNVEVFFFHSIFDILQSTCPLMPLGDKGSIRYKLYCSNK